MREKFMPRKNCKRARSECDQRWLSNFVTGQQMIVNRSRNFAEITKAMFSADVDTLTFNVEEWRVGIVTLSYGNGSSGLGVISRSH